MNWKIILTVYLKELKDSLRDRRTLISMIVIPTLVMPIIMFGVGAIMTKVVRTAREEASRIVILGGADSPGVVVEIPEGFEAALTAGAPKTVTLYHYEGEMKSGIGASAVERFFRDLREKTIENRLTARGQPAHVVNPFEV